MTTRRGTTNRNQRGGSHDRRRRKAWLVQTYRANVDVDGQVACRCYRCGALLTVETVTVDRIIPAVQGGTYRRANCRPACGGCNSETGNYVRTWRPVVPTLASVTIVQPPRMEVSA